MMPCDVDDEFNEPTTARTIAIQTDENDDHHFLQKVSHSRQSTKSDDDLLSHFSSSATTAAEQKIDDANDSHYLKAVDKESLVHDASNLADDGYMNVTATNDSKTGGDKPTLGLAYYVIHTILMTGNMYA